MILVVGTFRLPLANFDRARPMMEAVVAATNAEDGCHYYAYARDLIDPEVIRISETWRDRECLGAHLKSAHMATWAAERAELGLSDRDIRIWDVGEGEAV
ncbi:putative quinol monooxygenase [Novosphingobium lentum]|uniref:putative quinol monooxygenase n=1 Tax=Novosphingobium lentum TaxID=145287 RepID=UPI00082BDB7A|nr:putative quinol monooxygenase [Novosphingobium lentum]